MNNTCREIGLRREHQRELKPSVFNEVPIRFIAFRRFEYDSCGAVSRSSSTVSVAKGGTSLWLLWLGNGLPCRMASQQARDVAECGSSP